MKSYYFTIVFLLFVKFSFGQLGLYSNDSLYWQQRTYYTTGPSGPGQGMQYYYTYNNYYLKGDTTINNQLLKKLYFSSSTSSAAVNFSSLTFNSYLFEDSNCVYKGTPNNFVKVLDYNLTVGQYFKFNGYSPSLSLISIDSVLINGSYYKRFNFQKGIKWIRGLGDVIFGASFNSYSFFNPSGYSWMWLGSEFRCYYEDNMATFGAYCPIPLDVNKDLIIENLNISPNPANYELNIEINSSSSYDRYEIYSLIGQKMKEGLLRNNCASIHISELSSGYYFLKTSSKTQETILKQFVKN